jgi:hypothetical protein
VAIANGDFATAEQNFRNAVAADADFGSPRIWLAQILAWRGPEMRADWREQVSRGIASPSGLSERDRLLGTAVTRLGDRRYPEACAAYARLTAADSLDFVSLYGLGQCQALDSLVIRSTSSASGWRFRSRYSDAANAYMRSLRVNPNAHSIFSFEQLQDMLPTASNKTRRGTSIDGQDFAAYAMLVRDTVVFVPYPLAQFANLPADQTVAARNAAIDADLQVLSDFATDWTRRAPTSAPAFLSLAEVMEARGEIDRSRSGPMSAIDAVAKARSVAATPHDRLLAASKEAWLRFKQGDFVSARVLADSLMQTTTSRFDEAKALIGLAALTGKIGKTSELARLTHDYAASASDLAVPIMEAAAPSSRSPRLVCVATQFTPWSAGSMTALAHFVAESEVAQVRRAVKASPEHARALYKRQIESWIDANNKLLNLQRAFATNDQRKPQRTADKSDRGREDQRPGDISLEHTYQVAWLRCDGDTLAAERQLDRALGALPSLSAVSLRDAASAAAAGRAMALRAELANARRETDDRRKWSKPSPSCGRPQMRTPRW